MPDPDRQLSDGELVALFHDKRADLALLSAGEQERLLNLVPKTAEKMPPIPNGARTPTGGVFERMGSNYLQALLPSTTLSDYWQGPIRAVTHPIDSAGLVIGAVKDTHADQFKKAGESMAAAAAAKTIPEFASGAAGTFLHSVAGIVPFMGPAVAQRVEQAQSGDLAGAAGGLAGLATPFGIRPALKVAAPLRNAAASGLRGSAVNQMESALAATTRENKVRAARVAPQMVERGIWNRNLPALEARAAERSDVAGRAVGEAVDRVADQRADVLPLVERMEQAKAEHLDTNDAGGRVVINKPAVEAVQALQDVLMEYGDQISMRSLNKVRQNWDATVQRGKGFTTDDVTQLKAWAAREGRSVLREELGRASPDIDRVMAEFSFWQNVEDIAHATNERRVGQSGNLTPTIAGAGGAVLAEALAPGSGIATKLGAAAIGGKLAADLRRLLNSPGYKMFTAVQKNRLADALATGDKGTISTAVSRSLSAVSSTDSVRAFPPTARGSQDAPDTPDPPRPNFAPQARR